MSNSWQKLELVRFQKNTHRGGVLAALKFKLEMPNGKTPIIRLPADSDKVFEAMKKAVVRPHNGTMQRLKEQSARTAWKLMQDWVEVQVSLIHMQQADPVEVFLPYVFDERKQMTLYQQLKSGGFKALLPEKTE